VPSTTEVSNGVSARLNVGQDLRDQTREAEDELDRVIVELGDHMVRAMKDGDPDGARIYQDRMYSAIKSRSPSHQDRLSAEIERRLDEGCCFFAAEGDKAAASLKSQGGAVA
jgi:hypothetical protein